MATTFLEPGGDATYNVDLTTAGSFWVALVGVPTIATDFVHGGHIKSIKYAASNTQKVVTPSDVLSDAGSRLSFYVYYTALPSNANESVFSLQNSSSTNLVTLTITQTTGVLTLRNGEFGGTQIGANGPALSAGIWYRISLAYTITSTSVNRFELFINGLSAMSVINATLTTIVTSRLSIGKTNAANDSFRSSDHYVDNSASLTDTGNIWVTAKRPNANGTTNGFTGSGAGSGYGTGNSVYINERALSTSSLVSKIGAGSAVTEEYNIESVSAGDINITRINDSNKIIDYAAWVYTSALAGETIQVIVNNIQVSQAITSTNTMYVKYAGSTTYPAGTGTDIGIITDTSLTTVSLFECGIMVAYIPEPVSIIGNYSPYIRVGGGQSRNERAT